MELRTLRVRAPEGLRFGVPDARVLSPAFDGTILVSRSGARVGAICFFTSTV